MQYRIPLKFIPIKTVFMGIILELIGYYIEKLGNVI